jgi:hypothetical protein
MAPLFFTCPKTNQQAPTGIETDVQSLSASWKATLKVNCVDNRVANLANESNSPIP